MRVSARVGRLLAISDWDGALAVDDDEYGDPTRKAKRRRARGPTVQELDERLRDPAIAAVERRREEVATRVFEIFGTLPFFP